MRWARCPNASVWSCACTTSPTSASTTWRRRSRWRPGRSSPSCTTPGRTCSARWRCVMADDPLAEALADLAPDVDVSASWATTGRTIRRRRRRQVAGLVVAGCLVAVASVSVALARPDGDGVDLAIYVPTPTTTPVPDELTITCDGGVGSLSTDVVQTNPAGVRVTIDGGEAGGTVVVVAEAEPDDATVFLRLAPRASGGRPVSGDGSSYPPGRFEVRCGSLEDGDLRIPRHRCGSRSSIPAAITATDGRNHVSTRPAPSYSWHPTSSKRLSSTPSARQPEWSRPGTGPRPQRSWWSWSTTNRSVAQSNSPIGRSTW